MKNKNTYSLLIESQEKGRSIFETVIYGLVVLCVAFTGWQFAAHAVVLPGMNHNDNNATEMVGGVPADQPIAIAQTSDASPL